MPPIPETSWKRCRPWASNVPEASRPEDIGARAVLEACGQHLFQDVLGKGGNLVTWLVHLMPMAF